MPSSWQLEFSTFPGPALVPQLLWDRFEMTAGHLNVQSELATSKIERSEYT
jgi:hypothetical protein